jgi:pimeloyl-ACP methyl ester carboxylesterase
MADILDLVRLYTAQKGAPQQVYLVGASEGGLITTLLVEQQPDTFTAGLAVCGPVGDFPWQINYFGDARATFQYFFPKVIPGPPFAPSAALAANWPSYYENEVQPVVFAPANRHRLDQWVKVARLPFDPERYLETVGVAVRDVLRYAVVNLTDASQTLGGFPFDNRARRYSGSANDRLLNRRVPRRSASASALQAMRTHYNTTGRLQRPLITLHTLRDQQVPYFHAMLYSFKTFMSGSFLIEHVNMPVNRFGHCNVTATEAIGAFALMLLYAGDFDLLRGRLDAVVPRLDRERFARLAQQYGLPYRR